MSHSHRLSQPVADVVLLLRSQQLGFPTIFLNRSDNNSPRAIVAAVSTFHTAGQQQLNSRPPQPFPHPDSTCLSTSRMIGEEPSPSPSSLIPRLINTNTRSHTQKDIFFFYYLSQFQIKTQNLFPDHRKSVTLCEFICVNSSFMHSKSEIALL